MLRLCAEDNTVVRVTSVDARHCSRVLADMLDAVPDTGQDETIPVPVADGQVLRDIVSLCRRFPALWSDAPEPYTGTLPTAYRRLADMTQLALAAYRLQSPNVQDACLRTIYRRHVRDGRGVVRVARASVRTVQQRCARLRDVCADGIVDED